MQFGKLVSCRVTAFCLWIALAFGLVVFTPAPLVAQHGTPSGSEAGQEDAGSLTPAHVYQSARRIHREVLLIREEERVSAEARDPGTQVNKVPLDVYQKSIELMDKVARYQQSLGMTPLEVRELPFELLSPGVVLDATQHVLSNLRRIKEELGIDRQIEEPSFEPGRNPTEVYELLWRSSYLLDGLTRALQPSDVFVKEERIRREIELLAGNLDQLALPAQLLERPLESFPNKVPRDVLMENFVNMYVIARIQRALDMQPFYVPPLPGGSITPANVYDTALVILGQLHRIKAEAGIELRASAPAVDEEKTPSDVYAVAKRVQGHLQAMHESVADGRDGRDGADGRR